MWSEKCLQAGSFLFNKRNEKILIRDALEEERNVVSRWETTQLTQWTYTQDIYFHYHINSIWQLLSVHKLHKHLDHLSSFCGLDKFITYSGFRTLASIFPMIHWELCTKIRQYITLFSKVFPLHILRLNVPYKTGVVNYCILLILLISRQYITAVLVNSIVIDAVTVTVHLISWSSNCMSDIVGSAWILYIPYIYIYIFLSRKIQSSNTTNYCLCIRATLCVVGQLINAVVHGISLDPVIIKTK